MSMGYESLLKRIKDLEQQLAEAQARIAELEDEREKWAQQLVIAGILRDNLSDQLTTARTSIRELKERLAEIKHFVV